MYMPASRVDVVPNVRRTPTNIFEISISFHLISFIICSHSYGTSMTIIIVVVVESSRVGRRRWHDSIHRTHCR